MPSKTPKISLKRDSSRLSSPIKKLALKTSPSPDRNQVGEEEDGQINRPEIDEARRNLNEENSQGPTIVTHMVILTIPTKEAALEWFKSQDPIQRRDPTYEYLSNIEEDCRGSLLSQIWSVRSEELTSTELKSLPWDQFKQCILSDLPSKEEQAGVKRQVTSLAEVLHANIPRAKSGAQTAAQDDFAMRKALRGIGHGYEDIPKAEMIAFIKRTISINISLTGHDKNGGIDLVAHINASLDKSGFLSMEKLQLIVIAFANESIKLKSDALRRFLSYKLIWRT